MKKILFFLMVFIFALIIGVFMAHDPGYALFAYGHWTVQMPLWVAASGLVVGFIILYNLLLLLRGTGGLAKRIKIWHKQHKQQKSYEMTNRGLLELAEGRWAKAEQLLLKAIDYNATPLMNYLGAAKAAQEQNADERRDEYLKLAHESTPGAEIAIGLTQAQLQQGHAQLEHSLATLRHLQHIDPKHVYVLKMLKQVYEALHDWQGLKEILPALKKEKVLKPTDYAELEINVYSHLIRQLAEQSSPEILETLWSDMPKHLHKEKRIIIPYVAYLHEHGVEETAESILFDSIKYRWDKDYINLYGKLKTNYPEKQLERAEQWLKQYGSSASLYLCLGRLSLRNELWGKARIYLKQCLDLEDNLEACMELGRLMEFLGEKETALHYYRQGLMMQLGLGTITNVENLKN